MEKINMNLFKNNKGLVVVTILLALVVSAEQLTKPMFFSNTEAYLGVIILFPFIVWWFMAFWNRILSKIFPLKEISYGVSFLLMSGITILFG